MQNHAKSALQLRREIERVPKIGGISSDDSRQVRYLVR